jgi:hypothetical protein
MKRSFVSTDPASQKGQTDIWLTPLDLIQKIGGDFDYDPCPFLGHKTANILELKDGLKSKWFGKVWLNPPYSEADVWVQKLAEHGYGQALLFARTGSKWMQRALRSADSVCFLKGRVSFMKPDKTFEHNAGADSLVLSFGCEIQDKSLGLVLK